MTLEFRDHQILVISPGSQMTQSQMGLSESLMPPAYDFPTVVYRDSVTGKFSMSPLPSATEIHPVVGGRIADLKAFQYLLKMIYKSVKPLDGLAPALFLVASLSWTRRELEMVTRYLFEDVGVPALSVSLQGVSASYVFANPNSLVIDVGLDKTEISSVMGFDIKRQASTVLPFGGSSINTEIKAKLSKLSDEQIEDLKRSEIFEVLSDEHAQNRSNFTVEEEADGVVDIAAIVASDRTREILDQREKSKNGVLEKETNTQKATNTFTDRKGETIEVGFERFNGTKKLVSAIVNAVADVVHNLQLREQQQLFENVVIIGKGSLVNGLRTFIADRISARYVIRPRGTTGVIVSVEDVDTPTQAPSTLNLSRLPDHFPEWKTRKWEDTLFLGAQIGAKQVFTTGMEGLFVSRQDYNEVGPSSICDSFN